MSDYLANLAARSLDPAAAAVRPRLASRFEPLAPWAPPLAMERPEEARIEEPAAVPARPPRPVEATPIALPESVEEDSPAPARSRRSRRRAMAEPAAELAPEPPPAEAPRARLVPAPRLTEAPEPIPSAMVPPQGVLVRRSALPFETSPPVPLSRGERGNDAEAKELVGYAVRTIAHHGAHSAPYGLIAPETSPLSSQERGGGEAPKGIPPESRPSLKREIPAVPLLQPRVVIAERAPSPVLRMETPPAPTIQVTIGRIEVRATPPPAQPSRPRASAPSALSLEEYLRQRSRGTGR